MKRFNLKLIIGAAISLVCLYFVFRGVSIRALMGSFRQSDGRWIAIAVVVYLSGYAFRCWRWEIILRPIKAIAPSKLFSPLIIGFFANNILPFRMGELVRAHVAGQKLQISRTASLGSILLERICDMISFLLTFLTVALFFPFPANVKKGAYAMSLVCSVLIAALLLGLVYQHKAHAFIQGLTIKAHWKNKLQHHLTHFSQGVSSLKQGSYVLRALLLSLGVWVVEGTVLYLIARSFSVGMSYPQSFFVLFFLGLSVTLPQAPGYVGTFELFGVTALSLLGIPREKGLPVILAIHAFQFSLIGILGLGTIWMEGLSVRGLLADKNSS